MPGSAAYSTQTKDLSQALGVGASARMPSGCWAMCAERNLVPILCGLKVFQTPIAAGVGAIILRSLGNSYGRPAVVVRTDTWKVVGMPLFYIRVGQVTIHSSNCVGAQQARVLPCVGYAVCYPVIGKGILHAAMSCRPMQ